MRTEPPLPMRQLLLNLEAPKPPSLETFVSGRNTEATRLLGLISRSQMGQAELTLDQRFVYLWGATGAGKTHLLRSLAGFPGAMYLAGDDPAAEAIITSALATPPSISNPLLTGHALYLIDDCDRLPPSAQIAAFALFNQLRATGGVMVTAGMLPPLQLALRDDLRSRLGWGLIYHLHELSDAEKLDALTGAAQARSLLLSPGVLPYLITHFQRDMRSLSAMLDALDRYSLETQRPITLPLLRNLLQQEGEPSA